MPYIGQLRAAGLAKETVVGTLVTPPTEFIPYVPPDSFMPTIELLESTEVRSNPNRLYKAAQGAGDIKGLKLKWEAEPENIGNLLMAVFGTDTTSEYASYTISSSNNKINFKEDGGSELTATLTSGTYIMGASSAVAGSLCKEIKDQLEAAAGSAGTYTVTYNSGTRKITITVSGGAAALQLLWLTGTNQANAAYAVLGWTHANTNSAAAQTSDSTTTSQVYQHLFTRLSAAQLPSYSWWFDKGVIYPQFVGCMVNKMDLIAKAREYVMVESEWTALGFDDTGITQSPSYSAVAPWKFDMAQLRLDAGLVQNYDNLKISFDNYVKADHLLNQNIYPGVIYSEGFDVTISMDMVVEDAVQYQKFLNGTEVDVNVQLVHTAMAGNGAIPYSLEFDLPRAMYSVASYPNPQGLLKVSFTARGIYSTSESKIASVALRNSISTSY